MDDDPDWTYTWYKDGQRVQTDEATFNSDASTYAIIYASPLHRGSYTCSAKLKGRSVNSKHSPQETLHVYGGFSFFPGHNSLITCFIWIHFLERARIIILSS